MKLIILGLFFSIQIYASDKALSYEELEKQLVAQQSHVQYLMRANQDLQGQVATLQDEKRQREFNVGDYGNLQQRIAQLQIQKQQFSQMLDQLLTTQRIYLDQQNKDAQVQSFTISWQQFEMFQRQQQCIVGALPPVAIEELHSPSSPGSV